MPGLCREYVSSFDDFIPLETLSYERLNGVSLSGVNILWTYTSEAAAIGFKIFRSIIHQENTWTTRN